MLLCMGQMFNYYSPPLCFNVYTVVLTLTVGMVTTDLGLFWNSPVPSVQALSVTLCSPVIYENASIFDCRVSIRKVQSYGLLIFGVVAMVAGSITAIVDAVSSDNCSYTPQALSSQEKAVVIYQNCTIAV